MHMYFYITGLLIAITIRLLSEYGLSHDEFNLGVLWARVAPQHGSLLESAELLLNVFVPWLPVELPYRSRCKYCRICAQFYIRFKLFGHFGTFTLFS